LNQFRLPHDQEPRVVRGKWGIAMRFDLVGAGLILAVVLVTGPAAAYDAYDPHNCNGADWDDKRVVAVSKVIAKPRVNFVKSPNDDDFKAENCPAETEACRKKSYLINSDLVLAGRVMGTFTCIPYQSPLAKKQIWATGWLPSAALAPVAPTPSPKASDWVGIWYHPGGSIAIRQHGGMLLIEAGMTVPMPSGDFQNGDFKARVAPQSETIVFTDEGSYGDGCQVRLQRIDRWLLAEDNSGCGGSGVSFTGLYRSRK
jgi:hypothetical protein